MNSISDKAKIYNNVRLVDSKIAEFAVIADDCDLVNVVMNSHAEFGRRNIIRSTNIGYGSYTGQNTTIYNAEIGNYCCISSDINIYGGAQHIIIIIYLFTQTIGIKELLE